MHPRVVLLFLLCCFLSWRCTSHALSIERIPEVPHGDAPGLFSNIMKRMYKPSMGKVSDGDVGKPLLLTPLIEQDELHKARRMARVDPYIFPGHNMESYAGFLTVNEEYNGNLFFWYFPVAGENVKETPWIIWLQGGPGSPSLFGLFTEIGPILVNKLCDDYFSVEEMPYSWGKNHSLLFIDNPVGTGFSFTDPGGLATNQTTIGKNLYTALQQFLTLFPELRTAPLTIAGESYAGKHVPSLGIQIHRRRKYAQPINLYGLAIGNGFIDPISLLNISYFVRETGLVSDQVADKIKHMEATVVRLINAGEMTRAWEIWAHASIELKKLMHLPNLYNFLLDYNLTDINFSTFITCPVVRRAIHVGNAKFTSLNDTVVYSALVPDFMNSAKHWLEELLDNYPVMLYNGHLDTVVPYHASLNIYKSLSFYGADEFKTAERKPWYHNGRLAGYHRSAGNLREVMVRGAGHMVPADQPAAALGLISAFVRGLSLDQDTGPLAQCEMTTLRHRKLSN